MNVSIRNKKVAISRWKKKHSEEKGNIKVDEETLLLKASICGFLAGDGSVQKRKEKSFYHYQLDFFPDDELMMTTYVEQISKVYHKLPLVKKEHMHYSVRLSSKVIVEDLCTQADFGLKKWWLPLQLFKNPEAKKRWLKAFFSAEAYVNAKMIKIQTINKKGMKDLSRLLNEVGINHHCYEYNSKKTAESPVSIIVIGQRASRMRFYSEIGFWHQKKTKILKEALAL